jgi:hypothetical protein
MQIPYILLIIGLVCLMLGVLFEVVAVTRTETIATSATLIDIGLSTVLSWGAVIPGSFPNNSVGNSDEYLFLTEENLANIFAPFVIVVIGRRIVALNCLGLR